jgi:hypothetical protein
LLHTGGPIKQALGEAKQYSATGTGHTGIGSVVLSTAANTNAKAGRNGRENNKQLPTVIRLNIIHLLNKEISLVKNVYPRGDYNSNMFENKTYDIISKVH